MTNTLRRSVWQTIGFILAVLYALGVVVMVVTAAVAGGTSDASLTGQVTVIAGAAVVLGWWVIPLLAFGVDATLDPQRFVTFAIPRRRLLLGLAAAGLTSIPGAATLLVAVGTALAWWRTPVSLLAAVLGGLLAVALCVVGSRALTTALAPLLDSRRWREVIMVVTLAPVVLAGPAFGVLSGSVSVGGASAAGTRSALDSLASALAWTPLGAPWGLGPAVHAGEWTLAGARLIVALATLAVLWWVWDLALARSQVRPPTAASHGLRGGGLGWFDHVPGTPTGAVAARCLTYWRRDPRYAASITFVPLLPVFLLVVGGGVSQALLLSAPAAAWLLAFSISADISYDHTAFALHCATGVSGRADRAGRVLALTVLAAPLLALFLLGSVALTGRWDLTGMLLGLTVGVFGVTAGVSSVMSAWLVYPAPKPGESPLKQPQGAGMATALSQALHSLAALVLTLPVVVPAILTLALSPVFGWVTLGVGLVLGVGGCHIGISLGAQRYDRRTPELLQQVMARA